MSFPKWQYTATKLVPKFGDFKFDGFIGRIIQDQAELDRLGGTWYDTPALLQAATSKENVPVNHQAQNIEIEKDDEKSFWQAKLDEKNIPYDKRWGVAKLKEQFEL